MVLPNPIVKEKSTVRWALKKMPNPKGGWAKAPGGAFALGQSFKGTESNPASTMAALRSLYASRLVRAVVMPCSRR